MSGTDRHTVLIDLDRKESRAAIWQRIVLILIGTALAAAALLSQQRSGNEPTPAPTATPKATGALLAPRPQLSALALPSGVTDVQLSAFPDWLPHEPPPASLRPGVAIRGTMGIASGAGFSAVEWPAHSASERLG